MRHSMIVFTTVFFCTLVASGCAVLPEQNANVQTDTKLALQRTTYLSQSGFPELLEESTGLELRILGLGADEPLALGALGSALLEANASSLTAHHALAVFYQHVDAEEGAALHRQQLDRLKQNIAATGNGSRQQPYRVLSRADARLFVSDSGNQLVGDVYQSNSAAPLQLLVLSRPNTASPVASTYFDLSDLINPVAGENGNPWDVLRILADAEDTAAQAAIGTYLARQQRYDTAIRWLELASRDDNLLARTLLARIYWYQSGLEPSRENADEQGDLGQSAKSRAELTQLAIDNHIAAIGLGSTESMYTLARVLLEDATQPAPSEFAPVVIDSARRTAGAVDLLEQAGALGYAEAYLYLGRQYQRGNYVEANEDLANAYFAKAAELNNPKAIISYARYIANSPNQSAKTQIIPLLSSLAESGDAEAMVVLGNMFAKGVGVKPSTRKAIRWYKKAVSKVQASHHGDAAIVNEVAWTLAVTDRKGLHQPGYAQTIMDAMMNSNKQVQRHPEYLDTWAATYAANGNFEKAIELQRLALQIARNQEREDVIDILKAHLKFFEAGTNIKDRTP
jgi:TPR repeat protein